jgi:glycolate oxidase FAD binding subunit
MKNVTGLDLVKLVCGAWGTLGILSEVVFKVLPKPERTASVIIDGLEDNQAIAALSVALGSPFEVSGAAHIPRSVAPTPVTVVRVEGFDASVAYRLQKVATILKRFGDTRVLDGAASSDLWLRIRDVRWLAQPAHSAVWRLSLAPAAAAAVVAEVGQRIAIRHLYDWGGGLVWLAVDAPADAGAEIVRGAMQDKSGHATLVRAPEVLRATVDVYQPLPPVLRKLTEGIKASFDPKRIFNPGRMYAGI